MIIILAFLSYSVTATFGKEGNKVDIELSIPLDRSMSDASKYQYKKKLKMGISSNIV